MSHSNFLVYTASAGSGKTFALTKDYLKILLTHPQDDAYKSILAITFTNKAVEEMKSRILGALQDFAGENTSKNGYMMLEILEEEAKLTINQLKFKAKKVLKNLLHQYGSFEISTIDKFTHRIIRTFSNELKLSNNFQVNLDFDELLNKAIDELLSKAGDDEILTKHFVDFSINKIEDNKSWNIKFDLNDVGKILSKEQNIDYLKSIANVDINTFLDIEKQLKVNKKNIESQLENQINDYLIFLQNIIPLEGFSRSSFPNLINKLKDFKKFPIDELDKYQSISDIKVNKSFQETFDVNANDIFNQFSEIIKLAKNYVLILMILKEWSKLSLVSSIEQEILTLQKEQNILPIKEFNKLVNEQIQNQPAPFIYEKLGERYQHFFIDEFQDTSLMQWQNMIPLISNSLDSENLQGIRGSVMLVGDPKQSIYRFRGSYVEQMLGLIAGDNPFPNHQKVVKNLEYNYRSFSQIVSFNNDFFHWISDVFSNIQYAELYKESNQKIQKVEEGYVSIEFLETNEELTKDEQYLNKILDCINHVIGKGYQYKDIAILTRNNVKGRMTAKFLTENDIPITSSDSLLVSSSYLVNLCVYFIKFLDNKKEDNAKTELLFYFAKKQNDSKNYDFVKKGLACKNIEEFQIFLKNVDIDINFLGLETKTLYEQVSFFVHEIIKPIESDAYVYHFLQMVFEQNVIQLKTTSEFLNHWETIGINESISVSADMNAVNIMSYHKSKGLEFPVVILPFLNYRYEKNSDIWINTSEFTGDVNHIIVKESKKIDALNDDIKTIATHAREASLLDEVNALYVAMTRSREQLFMMSEYLFTKQGTLSSNNIGNFLVNYLVFKKIFDENQFLYNFGNEKMVNSRPTNNQNINYLTHHPINQWTNKIKISTLESELWASKKSESIAYGNLIHNIMAQITSANQVEEVINLVIQKGWVAYQDKNQILETVTQIIHHPDLEQYYSEDKLSWQERKILTKEHIYIPDRVTFVDEKTCVIIDYKTGQEQTKHQHQILTYASILEQMGYVVQKKILIYISNNIKIITL